VHEELDVSGVVNIGGAVDFESMGGSTSYRFYRITSRATGLTENTQVILQSTFVASEGL
jgi:Tfp pilus assembly protein PilX